MLYQVIVDGINILDYGRQDLSLINPELTMEIDTAGTFTFTIPYEHFYYDMFNPESIMTLTVEVWEDTVLHWFGRPIELELDIDKNKIITCEGALGYFNDSVVDIQEFDKDQFKSIFEMLIAYHNSIVPSSREFEVGTFDVENKMVYRKFDFEQCLDILKSQFLDAVDGHFFLRRENGHNYIDFLKDFPYTSEQTVEFGKNLKDFRYTFDGKDFATAVAPLGSTDEDGFPVMIDSVNDGSWILRGSAVEKQGLILKVQRYSDISSPYALLQEGQRYLTVVQYNAYLLECTAIDLHSIDNSITPFRLGQVVQCISEPHGIDTKLPITKMVIHLDRAEKEITLGNVPKKTLARFSKQKNDSGDYGGGGDNSGWAIIPPPDDGGTPTMKKVPIGIEITKEPTKLNYRNDETINTNGLEVKLLAAGTSEAETEYFVDERYPDSIVPLSELELGVTNVGHDKVTIQVPVLWQSPYDGRNFIDAFYVTNTTQDAIEKQHGGLYPTRIRVIYTGLDKYTFKPGQFIDFSKVYVEAYYPDGTKYNANGYRDGHIPNTELTFSPKQVNRNDITTYILSDSDLDTGSSVPKPVIAGKSASVTYNRTSSGKVEPFHNITMEALGDAQLVMVTNALKQDSGHSTYGIAIAPALEDGSAPNGGIHLLIINEKTGQTATDTTTQFNASYTKDGKKVYWATDSHGCSGDVYAGAYGTGLIVTDGHISWNPRNIAWTVAFGIHTYKYAQTVTVSWKAPNGAILTDTFDVIVNLGNDGANR